MCVPCLRAAPARATPECRSGASASEADASELPAPGRPKPVRLQACPPRGHSRRRLEEAVGGQVQVSPVAAKLLLDRRLGRCRTGQDQGLLLGEGRVEELADAPHFRSVPARVLKPALGLRQQHAGVGATWVGATPPGSAW